MDSSLFGAVGMYLVAFAIVLAICWILLPVATLFIEPLRRKPLRKQKGNDELLAESSQDSTHQPNYQ